MGVSFFCSTIHKPLMAEGDFIMMKKSLWLALFMVLVSSPVAFTFNQQDLASVKAYKDTGTLAKPANGKFYQLAGADLRGVYLEGADLQDAVLAGADLREANLQEANLFKANLSGAKLQKANLQRANLRHAKLGQADLSGANLRGVKAIVRGVPGTGDWSPSDFK